MTLKRLFLGILSVFAIALIGFSLLQSWNQPQIQSRLELYQTNLVLHVAEWQGFTEEGTDLTTARNTLIGGEPREVAVEQYQKLRQSAQTNLERVQTELTQLQALESAPTSDPQPTRIAPIVKTSPAAQQKRLRQSQQQLTTLIQELDLRLGVLQATQGQTQAATQTWNQFIQEVKSAADQQVSTADTQQLINTAQALIGLWSDPPRLLPNAEPLLRQQLEGWFRYQALDQLYTLQQRSEALSQLQVAEQAVAEQAVLKLFIVSSIPLVGLLVGTGLLIFLLIQRVLQGRKALLAQNGDTTWITPWNGEIVWQVFILGFFLLGQVLVPFLFIPATFGVLGVNPAALGERSRAFSILYSYGLLALGGIGVLYLSLKPYLPLPEGWFQFKWRSNWLGWGLGGYLVALPLVIVVSILNQQLWQGQGGSNPILPIALEGKDQIALSIFFITASIAAPLFEELMFRGFLLPSLTRYMPVWGAIALSSLLFAVAHLSLSEILPLTVLGMVLGVVYTRSRNLLAPMLLHSLWNSGTLLSLIVLGSGTR